MPFNCMCVCVCVIHPWPGSTIRVPEWYQSVSGMMVCAVVCAMIHGDEEMDEGEDGIGDQNWDWKQDGDEVEDQNWNGTGKKKKLNEV